MWTFSCVFTSLLCFHSNVANQTLLHSWLPLVQKLPTIHTSFTSGSSGFLQHRWLRILLVLWSFLHQDLTEDKLQSRCKEKTFVPCLSWVHDSSLLAPNILYEKLSVCFSSCCPVEHWSCLSSIGSCPFAGSGTARFPAQKLAPQSQPAHHWVFFLLWLCLLWTAGQYVVNLHFSVPSSSQIIVI